MDLCSPPSANQEIVISYLVQESKEQGGNFEWKCKRFYPSTRRGQNAADIPIFSHNSSTFFFSLLFFYLQAKNRKQPNPWLETRVMANQTGPTSFTGKLASSMNNLRHGSTAKSLFLSCENPEDFFALLANSFEHYQPSFDDHAALVTRAVQDHWILLRRERISNTFEHHLCEREPDPVAWSVTEMDHLHRFDRYKTEAARAYTRSLKNLQTIQKMERDEQKWQQQLAREKEKLAADVERWQHLKDKEQPPPPEPEPEPEPKRASNKSSTSATKTA
jgi:hypothetical protein